jgi:hypothetical protein
MTAYARRLAITAMLALVVAICTPVFVHRRDFDVAFSQWRKNKQPKILGGLMSKPERPSGLLRVLNLPQASLFS